MESSWMVNIAMPALVSLWAYARFAPVKGLRTLSPPEFGDALQQEKDTFLLDVREPHEFRGGSIPGAGNIPLSQLPKRMVEIPREREVLLYCRSGIRSKQAAKLLSRRGFSKLAHLRGGLAAWKGPITKELPIGGD
ncbi:rhodanese-related sulfurtransferase [Paenibacillus mucilaginosus]|uniref:rhodanese-like domain-containing protein n=1 Tax=Paenibacillus mucilaginosus TaxID=61624 RepID=UPI003D1C03FB